VLARVPYYELHRCNLERKRADTIRRVCAQARRLERLVDGPIEAATARLTAVAGIGPWTAAEVGLVALGDADAVSVGDYHLPHQVCFALAGERRGSDHRMLELLAPFAGHRGRVCRLVTLAGLGPPRRGPRLAPRHIARI
jgi:3-methyladenine DNA glycosylase/8-oxoguanine DNA glycosylase